MNIRSRYYEPREELWNVITHGFGLILSIAALVLLVVYASIYYSVWHIVSFSIYGASLVTLYLASTIYHASTKPKLRLKLNVFDHSSIYVLIAGTYTPFLLVTLRGAWGWSLFGVIWGLALAGVILKLFYTGRFDKISTFAYVFMGWLVLVGIYPLIQNLALGGLIWLFAGGVFYTVGAVFYLQNKLRFNHAIFHVFVLLGSISHFISVFFYI
ncbi:MAG: PAQR family membrane homeostasis protein TrhA [Deltaproteobacteria bacterium]